MSTQHPLCSLIHCSSKNNYYFFIMLTAKKTTGMPQWQRRYKQLPIILMNIVSNFRNPLLFLLFWYDSGFSLCQMKRVYLLMIISRVLLGFLFSFCSNYGCMAVKKRICVWEKKKCWWWTSFSEQRKMMREKSVCRTKWQTMNYWTNADNSVGGYSSWRYAF